VFGFFESEKTKLRRQAANWLEVAQRVYHFRRDQLSAAQEQRLQTTTGDLKRLLKEQAENGKVKGAVEKLEAALREAGGRHYPGSSMIENVEFFLVASIVILGLRAYFLQPFKIPTNSMWPTYNGMTYELFDRDGEPGPLGRAGRLLAFGATRYGVTAPADGELQLPVFSGNGHVAFTMRPGKTFFFFPTTVREYTFSVGGEPVRITVPEDFDLERVLEEKFAGQGKSLGGMFQDWIAQGHQPESSVASVSFGGPAVDRRILWFPVGQTLKKGDKVVSFDILTGDLLFVDRISYNFSAPKVGQGFVFKTENIHSEYMVDANGNQRKQYYIKRLVGQPGDTLEVKSPVLLRNGQPIQGAAAFDKNAHREDKYPGYAAVEALSPGNTVTVAPHSFYAMGDNSTNSADSRYWGFVPEKDVVGRPLFIYYPLSKRWGPAR
jgi:signal peptidase I